MIFLISVKKIFLSLEIDVYPLHLVQLMTSSFLRLSNFMLILA